MELSSQNLKVIKGDIKWWEALTWSEAEWGIVGRPSTFDCIFSPIDKQADIMSQLELDDNIDNSPGGIVGEPLQFSTATNSFRNNHVDERTQLSVDDIDVSSVDKSLQLSKDEVLKDKKHSQKRNASSRWTEVFDDGYRRRKYDEEVIRGSRPQRRRRKHEAEKTLLMVPAPRFGNTEIPPDDGFIWRKYGQKDIFGSIYPRVYYRCIHQKLYQCQAKKQVHRLDSNPNIFAVTYRGSHTCHMSSTASSSTFPPQLILGKRGEIVTSETPDLSNDMVDNDRSLFASGSGSGSGVTPAGAEAGSTGPATSSFGADYPVADMADAMFNSGGIVGDPLQSSCVTNASMNNQVDLRAQFEGNKVDIMTQIGNDGDDIDHDAADHPRQNADSFSRVKQNASRFTLRVRSEVEFLEDGYRWRKYHQRVMDGSKYPRLYFKCTHPGCPVKKSGQRSDDDPKIIETGYAGIHTHTAPQHSRSLHGLQSSEIESSEPLYPSNEKVDKDRSYSHKNAAASPSRWTEVYDDGYIWSKHDEEVVSGPSTP